jgi:hypothetical protein
VRFHRWLGHWTMTLASAHSIGFWGVWVARGMWLKEAFAQGARVNNLAGGLSFLGGLALWLTSVEWARRANYALFIAAHHVGWWLFFLAGAAHYSPIVWWFAPGLVLYFADAAFRVWSNSGNGNSGGGAWGGGKRAGGNVLALEVAWEKGAEEEQQAASVVAVVVRAPRGFAAADAGIVWARCPQLSRWQWHPFEYLLVEGQGKEGGDDSAAVLAMHVKSYGRWSRAFARLAREAALSAEGVEGLDLRVEAPYGDGPPPAAEPPSSSSPIVVLAGGIGATAALSLLRELEREKSGEEEQGGGHANRRRRRPMLFVWTSRHAPELVLLLPRLIDAAERAGVDLDARLFFTGRGGVAALTAPGAWASAAAAASAASPSSSLLHLPTPPAEAASSQCPVLAPGRWLFQLAQRLSAHLLAFAGATAALLAVRWWSVVAPEGDGWTTAQTGLASAVGLALGAALPALAVIAVARAVMVVVVLGGGSAREGGGGTASKEEGALRRPLLDSATATATTEAAATTTTAGGGLASRVRFVPAASGGALAVVSAPTTLGAGGSAGPLAELPLSLGRPSSLRAMVGDWLAAVKGSDDDDDAAAAPAELFAMGPEALVAEARALCSGSGNGNGNGLLFRLRTHEL